jgi:hypothetical protein
MSASDKVYKVICKCHACGGAVEVEFLLPPTEDDKLGFYCNDCEGEGENEKSSKMS